MSEDRAIDPRGQEVSDAGLSATDYETFVRLFAQHSQRIFAFIMSLLPDRVDAEEVFQETSVVLWRAFGTFRRDGDFGHWGCGISLNQVRKFRRQRRSDRLVFHDGLLEKLARDQDETPDLGQRRQAALADCLEKLRAADRDLVRRCYHGGTTFKEVAGEMRRPVNTVYKALGRIRRALMQCIDRRLAEGNSP